MYHFEHSLIWEETKRHAESHLTRKAADSSFIPNIFLQWQSIVRSRRPIFKKKLTKRSFNHTKT